MHMHRTLKEDHAYCMCKNPEPENNCCRFQIFESRSDFKSQRSAVEEVLKKKSYIIDINSME